MLFGSTVEFIGTHVGNHLGRFQESFYGEEYQKCHSRRVVALVPSFLIELGLPKEPKPGEGPPRPYEGSIQPGPVVVSGNPPAFFREHGSTPGCNACSYPKLGACAQPGL